MPKVLEQKLRREVASKGMTGRRADAYTFGTLNNLGLMHGNVVTAKGKRLEKRGK